MGLSFQSNSINLKKNEISIKKSSENDVIVALAGNPNVGKSTVFNALTGLKQHTGNWPGKTISNAKGYFKTKKKDYVLVDLPGTYSLYSHSEEEEVARNFLCFGKADITIVLCDATCLEKNLNLALQIIEIKKDVILCINFLDEARSKGIKINLREIEERLNVPVVGITARKKSSLGVLLNAIDSFEIKQRSPFKVRYDSEFESAISVLEKNVKNLLPNCTCSRCVALHLLSKNDDFIKSINEFFNVELLNDINIKKTISFSKLLLDSREGEIRDISEIVTQSIYKNVENILQNAVTYSKKEYTALDRKLDKIFTSKILGIPLMIFLLASTFWITIVGANYPSEFLSECFLKFEISLKNLLLGFGTPKIICSMLCDGMLHVLFWVVSVMLPPMAIFFPIFSILEDSGYLPRVAYNLDKPFKKCSACGKQALTMCMGLGCNTAGVIGARIIDSKRERLLAIVTNNFVPCNGRFPMMILVISVFFFKNSNSLYSAMILSLFIVFGILVTFATTNILSKTLLKGTPSSFTLELPPYRKPQLFKTIVHSITDRTLFALSRAALVAMPAGLIIWLAANVMIDNLSILEHCAQFLQPFGKVMGLDGVILIAFILGFPANEIIIPIVIMAYTSGVLLNETDTILINDILLSNGWTIKTAICFLLFVLFHWPCSTTMLTIKKETGSIKWAILAFLIPTVIGITICIITNMLLSAINIK